MSDTRPVMVQLAELLSNFQGREYSDEITSETMFFGDLGFVSIDAIVLGETLEQQYGCPIPFQRFLGQLAEENVQDIAVGRLAQFLNECLSESTTLPDSEFDAG